MESACEYELLDIITVIKSVYTSVHTLPYRTVRNSPSSKWPQKTNDGFFFLLLCLRMNFSSALLLYWAELFSDRHRPRAAVSSKRQKNDSYCLLCGRHIKKYEKRLPNVFYITLNGQTKWRREKKNSKPINNNNNNNSHNYCMEY